MPIIAGQAFYDASGNAMTDASGNAIGEPDLPVSLIGGLVVLAGNNPLEDLIESLADIGEAITGLISGTLTMQAIRNMQDDLNGYLLNGGADTFSGHDPVNPQSNLSAEGIINSIGTPIIEWPEDPPTWYTNPPTPPTVSQIASEVWGNNFVGRDLRQLQTEVPAYSVMEALWEYLVMRMGYDGIPVPGRPYFRYILYTPAVGLTQMPDWVTTALPAPLPVLDLTLAQEDDTAWSYLTREYPSYTWLQTGPGAHPQGGDVFLKITTQNVYDYYRCTLTDADLRSTYQAIMVTNITSTSNLPLWPGLANVTLGTPVALSDQLVLSGPMHGVLVTVTTPPTKTGRRNVGGEVYDYGVGEIAFAADNGYLEPWQYLGFRTALFAPKAMEEANAAHFRVLAGAEGTARTFTRS